MAGSLNGLAVLIVEDEFYLADDLAMALGDVGAHVLGPFGRVEDACRQIEGGDAVDLAILDIGLVGERVFPVAELLRERRTPFLFATGYDADVIPAVFAEAPCLEKPVAAAKVVALLEKLWVATGRQTIAAQP
jgi:DNA-binding response OmpR family regulator